jgi:hypothetical protein
MTDETSSRNGEHAQSSGDQSVRIWINEADRIDMLAWAGLQPVTVAFDLGVSQPAVVVMRNGSVIHASTQNAEIWKSFERGVFEALYARLLAQGVVPPGPLTDLPASPIEGVQGGALCKAPDEERERVAGRRSDRTKP